MPIVLIYCPERATCDIESNKCSIRAGHDEYGECMIEAEIPASMQK